MQNSKYTFFLSIITYCMCSFNSPNKQNRGGTFADTSFFCDCPECADCTCTVSEDCSCAVLP